MKKILILSLLSLMGVNFAYSSLNHNSAGLDPHIKETLRIHQSEKNCAHLAIDIKKCFIGLKRPPQNPQSPKWEEVDFIKLRSFLKHFE